jgi:hypothetical protein
MPKRHFWDDRWHMGRCPRSSIRNRRESKLLLVLLAKPLPLPIGRLAPFVISRLAERRGRHIAHQAALLRGLELNALTGSGADVALAR